MQTPPAQLWNTRNIFLLMASSMTVMAGATLAPALPGMRDAFQHEPQAELWVKIILSIPGLCIAIAAPLIGWLIDCGNKKITLLIALLLCGISGSAGYLLHDSLQIILISRIVLGIAVAGIMVACITLASDYFSGPALGRYMGLQAAFGSFGGVVFLATAGFLAEINWTMPFLIYLLALLMLPGCAAALTEPQLRAKPLANTPSESISSKMMALCCALAILEVFVLYLIPLHLPFYLQEFGIVSASVTGGSIAGMLLVSALVSMNYRLVAGKIPAHIIHISGLGIISVALFGLAFSTHYWMVFASLLLLGAGIGIIRPNLIVWLFSFTPDSQRGRASDGITSCFFIGQIICPLLTQPFVQQYGYATIYGCVGGLTLIVVLMVWAGFSYKQNTRMTVDQ